jgi:mRNA turnover protein 4
MPKSKRAKVVHLTKVDKKGKELTLKLFAAVQESLDAYQYCFVFSVDNMRNTFLKQVRSDFPDSRYRPEISSIPCRNVTNT